VAVAVTFRALRSNGEYDRTAGTIVVISSKDLEIIIMLGPGRGGPRGPEGRARGPASPASRVGSIPRDHAASL
jgi:hypothetical protein